ncbi:MAG: hypothetical protein GY757_26255 [bacterium]|nr:hypothetical protein [bacterium]
MKVKTINRKFLVTFVMIIMVVFLGAALMADDFDDDEFSEDSEGSGLLSGIQFTGFLEIEQGRNITNAGPLREGPESGRNDWMMANRRFRLQTSKTGDKGGIYAKLDFIRDEITNKTYIDIRELRLQYKVLSWMDISVGRQVSTWGVADMLFINDLFPKNWVANFQGRDMESMKDSSTSLRVTSYLKSWTLDVVYHPKFSPDTTPTGCYFNVFDPNSGGLIANRASCGEAPYNEKVSNSKKHSEVAVSLKKRFGSQEISLFGYRGFYKNPKGITMMGEMLLPYYPDLTVIGASTEGQLGPGILTAEVGYYNSREDKDGNNHFIENSMLKLLVGYRMDFSANLSLGGQWYQERMMDYEAYEQSVMMNPYRKKEAHNTFTLRVTYKAQQETLWLNIFTYYRPQDKDHFTRLDITKRFDDNFAITAGANIFTGEEHYEDREFGMLRHDDNVYIRLKYNF